MNSDRVVDGILLAILYSLPPRGVLDSSFLVFTPNGDIECEDDDEEDGCECTCPLCYEKEDEMNQEQEAEILDIADNLPGVIALLVRKPELCDLCRKHKMYGELVWVVFKDICHGDVVLFECLLRKEPEFVKKEVLADTSAKVVFSSNDHEYAK